MEFFIINRPENFREMLNEIGKAFLERCETYNMESLGKDLLLKVLGNIDYKDIKEVLHVCKYWNALFGTPEFWQPFVERKLKEFPLCVQSASMYFKTATSLKQGFDWIFVKGYQIRWDKKLKDTLLLSAKSSIRLCAERDCVHRIQYFIMDNISKKIITKKSCLKWYEFQAKPFEVLSMLYVTEDGIQFFGKSNDNNDIKSYDDFLPHGQGTWTFTDGSTFSGDNVAFEGVPHGKGMWNGKEKVEFEFGRRVKEGHKRRKIEWE
jgi:hypothetical protein